MTKAGGSLPKAVQEDGIDTVRNNTKSDEGLTKRETESNGQSGPSTASS